jgi:biotin carboxylase
MHYIFLYNVVNIKSDFSKLKTLIKNTKFILIGSPYCLDKLNQTNKICFEHIHEISRNFHEIDYNEIEQIVEKYVKQYGAQNIKLFTNEDSTQIACAKLREKYGIVGHNTEIILPFVNKITSKNKLKSKIKLPKFVEFNKILYKNNKTIYLNELVVQLGGFPLFAKPIDLVSSVETHRIDDFDNLEKFATHALSHEYDFEIDEFIDGELFHCDAMIINGKVEFFMIGKCSFALSRFFEGKAVGSIPIIDNELFSQIKLFNNQVFKILNCPDGAYHLELFLQRGTQELVFLEIAARTGGALITNVYEKVFGVNIEETNYLIQMGLTNKVTIHQRNIYAGFLNFPYIKGVVQRIKKPDISIDHEFLEFVKPNDELYQAKNLLDISCSIIFWDKDYNVLSQNFDLLKNYQPLELTTNINDIS